MVERTAYAAVYTVATLAVSAGALGVVLYGLVADVIAYQQAAAQPSPPDAGSAIAALASLFSITVLFLAVAAVMLVQHGTARTAVATGGAAGAQCWQKTLTPAGHRSIGTPRGGGGSWRG